MRNDKELRKNGYITAEEFVSSFSNGLLDYLQTNWGNTNSDRLHHPEDLATNASIYAEIAYRVVADMALLWQKAQEK